jgi:hypothetical protein
VHSSSSDSRWLPDRHPWMAVNVPHYTRILNCAYDLLVFGAPETTLNRPASYEIDLTLLEDGYSSTPVSSASLTSNYIENDATETEAGLGSHDVRWPYLQELMPLQHIHSGINVLGATFGPISTSRNCMLVTSSSFKPLNRFNLSPCRYTKPCRGRKHDSST